MTSPWCTTCYSGLIWSCEHAHQSWGQGEKVGSTKLFKFDFGQRGFWDILVNQNDFNWHEDLQGDHNMHLWLAGFSLDFYENISYRNISNLWNGQKWFWGDFMGLYYSPWHETWQDHLICHMWHDGIFLEFLENISFVNISKAWNIQKGF